MGQLFCMLLLLLLLLCFSYADCRSGASNSSSLELSVHFNLSMLSMIGHYYYFPDYNTSMFPSYINDTSWNYDLSTLSMSSVATPTLDAGGLFFPILSSPSFISSNSSPHPAIGFSLGFYFLPTISNSRFDSDFPCAVAGCNIYMALCAGSNSALNAGSSVDLSGALNTSTYALTYFKRLDGLAAPVWIANFDRPIRYADKVSLVVELVADSKGSSTFELQLRDGEDVVWRVRDVGLMEIQDTGHLLIYDSPNRTHLVWQSPHTDTLVEGQSLTVGKELVSNDSSYVARMEKGGLVLSMNKTHFNRELQPAPYWLFPVLRDDRKSFHFNINQLILSAPCSSSPASTDVMRHVLSSYAYKPGYHFIVLYPGSCSSRKSLFRFPDRLQGNSSWTFMRLESDGKLYSYAVFSPNGDTASVTSTSLDSADGNYFPDISNGSFTPPFLEWQECNVPMACGPLGVCTPGAKTVCTCLESYFQPINSTDFSQGCKHRINLPLCSVGNEHTDSTDFVQLESTASILLFNGWIFESTPAQVDACRKSCLSDCSCKGFFYQMDTSLCFFIIDEISLMTVSDRNLTFVNYTSVYSSDPTTPQYISAKNYVTHLKVISSSGRGTSNKVFMIAIIIVPSVVVCLVLGMAIYLIFRARQRKSFYYSMLAKEKEELKDILPLLPSRYSYKELYEATKGFNKLLGTGGCGSVYAGVLSDGRQVAVKVLQVVLQGAGQSKQFLAEVATVGHTGHHNIVRLVGFCWEVTQRLLVYEYVERGSLDRWIFVKESMDLVDETSAVVAPLLDWKTRYNIAIGIARGLSYLHEECEQPILHFDIKPQNILLGDDFVAKLADFGMSRLMPRDMTSVVTGVRGTIGYIAPEWYSHGTVSKKSDVYSMGMVLLEIVGGRKNLDFSLLNSSIKPEEQEAWHFPSWASKKCQQGLVMELVDKRLHVCGLDAEQVRSLIHIALWCIHDDPAMRPNAPTVLQWLEGGTPIEQPPISMVQNARRCPNSKVPISFS